MTTTRNTELELERVDGDTLLFKDGSWYRSPNDFDYGWCYQYPSMPHTAVRRGTWEMIRTRGFYLLMVTLWAVGLPAFAWTLVLHGPWWMLYAVPMTVFSWLLGRKFHRDMFKFLWHGYLALS